MSLASVGSELDDRAVAIALLGEEVGRVEDVDVIVRPRYTKVSMPYPEPMVSDGFEDHRRVAALVCTSKLTSPRRRVILPLPVHTIHAP